MKTIKSILVCLLLVSFAVVLSCNEESTEKPELENLDQETTANQLLQNFKEELEDKATRLFAKNEEVIVNYSFEMVLNERTGQLFIAGLKEQPIFPIASKEAYQKDGKKYSISCNKGGKVTKSSCSGKISCGTKVLDCLNAGGCATICAAPVIKIDNDKFTKSILDIDANKKMYEAPSLNPNSSIKVLDIQPNDKFSSVKLGYLVVK